MKQCDFVKSGNWFGEMSKVHGRRGDVITGCGAARTALTLVTSFDFLTRMRPQPNGNYSIRIMLCRSAVSRLPGVGRPDLGVLLRPTHAYLAKRVLNILAHCKHAYVLGGIKLCLSLVNSVGQ